ncbi:efflux RND transporter periplasmic adaptor subunit [Parabacteroides sp. FAFU027]|uniref:efflux RND transporter periplasmic adaptor subunit n=1 Tax=Parabacteroides sp. FAFU027 TaxID=2922715 RepID=UPI001FAF535D|nr:HlyD family efflux transporter periplasmic adaptor subunit [Parabacteroides sp. FAFU027]
MDRIIEDKRRIKPKHLKIAIPVLLTIGLILFMALRDKSDTFRIEKDKVTIDPVTNGMFQDYIQVVGVVEPIMYMYLDAIESGTVKEICIEEGNMVRQGDVILRLTNINLNLSILESEAQLAEKSNFLRETRINMEQQKLTLQRELLNLDVDVQQKKRKAEQNKALYADELISREDYLRSKEDYELSQKMEKLMQKRYLQDSIFRSNQVEKISQNLASMQRNLELIYQRQENLNVKAPVDGQLALLNAKPGQAISVGQRIGQINVLTSFKIKAKIDEHYIDRVRKGLTAYVSRETDTLQMEVGKVYPEVRDGRFEVDLFFSGKLPGNIRAGQSYNVGLQLGETQQAIMIPRGSFYQSTGGQWIYVLAADGKTAVKRNIRIGRQNPRSYEVLEGLRPGEKVVTSGYDLFGKNDKLVLK